VQDRVDAGVSTCYKHGVLGGWNLVLTLVGIVGLSTLIEWQARSRRWTSRQMLLRIAYREPLNIVVPTFEELASSSILEYDRALTSLGNLRAATEFSAAQLSPKKRIEVQLSGALTSEVSGDIVLLGGVETNALSELFLRILNANCGEPLCAFEEADEERNRIVLGTYCVEYNWKKESQLGSARDFGLVVVWVNPFTNERRRGILCSGFTSIGTHAAAAFLLRDLACGFGSAGFRRRLNCFSVDGRPIFPPRTRFWSWPHFAAVVEVKSVAGEAIAIHLCAAMSLPAPRFPLTAPGFGRSSGAMPAS
jgi:hypothetical protein